jgi:NAD(P)-dependent dehydrogenase (short-subunit alcohol dehydrogenase family)
MNQSLSGKVALVAGATRGAGRGIATDLDGSQPDAWRYLVEVEAAGKPADATGYR